MKLRMKIRSLMAKREMPISEYDTALNILDSLVFGSMVYGVMKTFLNTTAIVNVSVTAALSILLFYLFGTLKIGHVLNIIFSGIWALIFTYLLPIAAISKGSRLAVAIGFIILLILCLALRFDCRPTRLLSDKGEPWKNIFNPKYSKLSWYVYTAQYHYDRWHSRSSSSSSSRSYTGSSNTNNNSNSSYSNSGYSGESHQESYQEYKREDYSDSYQNNYNYQSYSKPKEEFTSDFFMGCKTRAELDKKYKFWIKHLHPDQPNGSEEMFKLVQEHYEKLKERF